LNTILLKLESLEKSQKETSQDVSELKESFKLLDDDVTEMKRALAEKANRKEMNTLNRNIDDLENRSKKGAEKDCTSVEKFVQAGTPHEDQPSGFER